MELRKRKDTFEMRCRKSQSSDCSTEGLRNGSWFQNSRIPLKDAVLIIVLWIEEYFSKQIVKESGKNPSTVVDFRNYLRNACSEICKSYPKIGGPGKIVQIDECAVHSRKYGRGEKERELTWILGGVQDDSRNCFLQIISNREAQTMIPVIRKFVDNKSDLYTDCHRSYSRLSKYFRSHSTVNHSKEFAKVLPDGSVVHTNRIESLWKRVQEPIKEGYGTSEALLPTYLDERVVREREKRPIKLQRSGNSSKT